jgi:type IV pilus assembly protein PilF
MRLGLNYLQRGDYEIALDKLEKALKQDPGLSPAHNTIAVLHQRLGQDDKAEHHFKQAIRYEPDYSEAHNNFGVFLCQAGRYKEAEQSFLEAVKNPLYRSTAQAYENAGLCVSRIPDFVLAKSYLRKALQINPNLSKSLLQMAELHYDEQDYLRARAYIDRYRTEAAWTPRALLLAIKIENHLGDQNAVSSYRVLLKGKFPDSDEALRMETGNF